jgi:hypothetical protein
LKDDSVLVAKSNQIISDADLKVFQQNGEMKIGCQFSIDNGRYVEFDLQYYDQSMELTIDPVCLPYSTFLGGASGDYAYDIAVENGFAYITGYAMSHTFPVVMAYDSSSNGVADCFVTKLAIDGQTLIYSTFLGGSLTDHAYAIAVENGDVYITGHTEPSDFPTVNAFNATHGGNRDCFVTKLAMDGQSLVYSTFLGGALPDTGRGIDVEDGYVYITGYTESSDYPTVNAYDGWYAGNIDCFITKLAVDGQSLVYSTYLGGTSYDYAFSVAVEEAYVYVTGRTLSSTFPRVNAIDNTLGGIADCFLTKFATDGQSLIYSTFIGGSNNENSKRIAVEDGYAYITGYTESVDYPVVSAYDSTINGDYDCFVTKLTPYGNSIVYSTFIGGSMEDYAEGIAVENGWVSITGNTKSDDYPITSGEDARSSDDSFLTLLSKSGKNLVYSVYIAGDGFDQGTYVAMKDGTAYVTGFTNSSSFPTKLPLSSSPAGNYDSFILVIGLDNDRDGICNSWEYILGTDINWIDSDDDNFLDYYEFAYGSDATDSSDYPAMPQEWYYAIYEDLDGNATLIQQIKNWLDGNHTAIQRLFFYVEGNATLLLDTIDAVDSNADELAVIAALATSNYDWLAQLNATTIGNFIEIREVMNMLGATVGDCDYDGLDDLEELDIGTDLQCLDTDCDNLNDAFEVKIGTDPLDDDSDTDSYLDGIEVIAGTDPLDASDYPGATTSTTTTTTTSTSTTTSPPPDEFSPVVLLLVIGGAGAIVVVLVVFIMKRRRG